MNPLAVVLAPVSMGQLLQLKTTNRYWIWDWWVALVVVEAIKVYFDAHLFHSLIWFLTCSQWIDQYSTEVLLPPSWLLLPPALESSSSRGNTAASSTSSSFHLLSCWNTCCRSIANQGNGTTTKYTRQWLNCPKCIFVDAMEYG